MSWVRLEDTRAVHPKMLRVGLLASGLDTVAICWCALHETDGFISDADIGGLWTLYGEDMRGKHGQSRLKAALKSLQREGRWEPKPELGGYMIHDFLEYNPSRAEQEERRRKTREKLAKWREAKKASNPVTEEPVTLLPSRPVPVIKTISSEIECNPVTEPSETNGHKPISDPAALELCEYLAQRIGDFRGGQDRRPKVIKSWLKDMDLLIRRGPKKRAKAVQIKPEVIHRCIAYVFDELAEPNAKGFCWAKQIQSPLGLREKWDQVADEKRSHEARSTL